MRQKSQTYVVHKILDSFILCHSHCNPIQWMEMRHKNQAMSKPKDLQIWIEELSILTSVATTLLFLQIILKPFIKHFAHFAGTELLHSEIGANNDGRRQPAFPAQILSLLVPVVGNLVQTVGVERGLHFVALHIELLHSAREQANLGDWTLSWRVELEIKDG